MSFGSELRRWADLTKRNLEQVSRETTVRWFSATVMATPVDEGRARGGWMPSVGTPAAGDGGIIDKSGAAVVGEIESTVEEVGVNYLTNNVIYIRELEHGYSAQAPNGMARVNLLRLRKFVKQRIRELQP